MTIAHITRRPGAGSLILIGGTSDAWRTTEQIDSAAVALAPRDKPIAFIPAAACPPDYGETFIETYTRLGSHDGYIVPIHDRALAHDPVNVRLIRKAGLIYFGGGETTALLESMTGTPCLEAVAIAYAAGAVVVGMSAGAIALCAHGVPQDPAIGLLQGWGWLPETVVSVHHTRQREVHLREALRAHSGLAGLGLPEDVAIALGPNNETQTLGAREPSTIPPSSSPAGE